MNAFCRPQSKGTFEGKGWMDCPEDGRDAYVGSLKGSFGNIYARYVDSFPRSTGYVMHALQEFPPKSLNLTHAEDSIFGCLNRTLSRTVYNLDEYVDLDAKSAQFMGRMSKMALIEVV